MTASYSNVQTSQVNRCGLVLLADACHFIAPLPGGGNFKKIIDPPTDGNFGKISPPLGVGITEKYPPSPGGCGFRKTMSGPFFGRRSASVPAGAVVSSLVYCLFSDGQRNCFKSQQFSDVGHFRTDGATNLPPTYSYGHNCRGQFSVLPPKSPRQKYELVYWLNFQRKYDLAPGR